jgi:dTDP-4-dehydrorhamnose reductase
LINSTLILGKGFLGSNIFSQIQKSGKNVFTTNHSNLKDNQFNLDITNIDSIENCVSKINPDVIINCVADTRLDYLESHSDLANSVNAEGAKNVALIAKQFQSKLIHVSTDSVFDGKKGNYSEDDVPNPINVYANSKFLGEKNIQKIFNDYVIVRTNFYGFNSDGNFLFNWILNNLKNNVSFTGFSDIIFSPLEITNLSKLIIELSNTNYHGILNLSSDEKFSKYDFALNIAEKLNLNKLLIHEGLNDEINFVAIRPKNTTLNNKKAKQLLKTPIISLSDCLNNNKQKF